MCRQTIWDTTRSTIVTSLYCERIESFRPIDSNRSSMNSHYHVKIERTTMTITMYAMQFKCDHEQIGQVFDSRLRTIYCLIRITVDTVRTFL